MGEHPKKGAQPEKGAQLKKGVYPTKGEHPKKGGRPTKEEELVYSCSLACLGPTVVAQVAEEAASLVVLKEAEKLHLLA